MLNKFVLKQKNHGIIYLFGTIMTLIYPCPTCQTPSAWQDNPNRPFCSERCKLIDLGEWASESYKVPAEQSPFMNELDNHTP